MLPHRFQKAIDRAAMVAGKKTAQASTSASGDAPTIRWPATSIECVDGSWPPASRPSSPPSGCTALVANGGWDPASPEATTTKPTDESRYRTEHSMTHTVISSATKEVVIGFDRPFVMIGEKINPTGRKLLAEEMKAGDFSRVEADALAQVAAGAQMLDVNAGIPLADEPALLAQAITLVQSITDVPLSIDSSIVEALEAGLAVYQGKPLVNSVTGEDEQMERVLPLVAKYGAAVVAISNDETGISVDPDVRFEVARKIVNRASDYGIPASDIVVDPLVMPIGAMGTRRPAGVQAAAPPGQRAEGQHHVRRIERQLRAAQPQHGHAARTWPWRSATA